MKYAFFAALSLTIALPASAQVLVAPQVVAPEGRLDVDAVLSLSEIEYDFDRGGDGEVERSILGAALGYGLGPNLNLYGELGYILEAELEHSDDDGDGVLLGGGVRGQLYQQNKFTLNGFGGLRLIFEDYGDGADGELLEIPLGLLGRYAVHRDFGLYGGVDVVPISEGELDVPGGDRDFDRDNPLGLRFGVDFALEPVLLNAEVAVISEEAFTLRAVFPL